MGCSAHSGSSTDHPNYSYYCTDSTCTPVTDALISREVVAQIDGSDAQAQHAAASCGAGWCARTSAGKTPHARPSSVDLTAFGWMYG